MTVEPRPPRPTDPVPAFEAARREMNRRRRQQNLLFAAIFLSAIIASLYVGEVRLGVLLEGLPNLLDYIRQTMPELHRASLPQDLASWYWALPRWLGLLGDTVVMAFTGTLLGAIGGFVLCFPASRNLAPNATVHFACRRLLEFARTVPELVSALVFVYAFGIGPLAGVLAIALHTVGALGKLFAEVNENADEHSLQGVRAAGGNWLQAIRFAIVPQVLPNFLSYALLRFEINVRAASVIGFVGAGGIGQELLLVIRQFIYPDISAIVLLIILAVSVIDISCERLRHGVIGKEALI